MTEWTPRCTGCGHTELEPGFVEDSGQSSQGYTRWIAGHLERGVFGGAKRMGRPRWAIQAYRCTRCALLHLYAVDQV